jgi:predicted esterase
MMTRSFVWILALLLFAAISPVGAESASEAEDKQLAGIATEALELTKELSLAGMLVEAKWALSVARTAVGESPAVTEAAAEVEQNEGADVSDEDRKKLGDKIAAARRKWAGDYLKMYGKKGKSVAPKYFEYLVRAIELNTADRNAWKKAADEVKARKAESDLLAAMVPRILTAEGAARKDIDSIIDLERGALETGGLLRKAVGHEMYYYIALPPKWSPDKRWPVLLTVEGAGCGFAGNHKGFVNNRGSLPLIIVTMHTFSNTNALEQDKYKYPAETLQANDPFDRRMEFDWSGFEAVHADIRTMFGAQEKVAVTGFSGGGNLTYYMALQQTARVFAAFPCCANFNSGLAQGAEAVPEDVAKGIEVIIFTGEKDPHRDAVHGKYKPGIEGQTDLAVEQFEKIGVKNIRRTMLPGVGHSACAKEVMMELGKMEAVKALPSGKK